ncbi:hypothetical protein HMPREF0653_02037 [Prevotella disiens JCM 6334 = ATCC 29426]|uniref:Uncharacterized protein n=1 Tax=Prevotella disiens JCM 6334 = ATCC 29426 TaxID=1235811 RepID=A0ABN0NQB7_9BACT|nr:hypothetical protein HMPREF0653_02037 [Prevotella disiens JCM 6334 = ATCC 29426]
MFIFVSYLFIFLLYFIPFVCLSIYSQFKTGCFRAQYSLFFAAKPPVLFFLMGRCNANWWFLGFIVS